MKITFILITVAVTLLLAGCGTIFKAAIALTDIDDSLMREWATLHNDGKTSDDFDRKVMQAQATFKSSCAIAAAALRAYDAGGNKADYIKALEAARSAIGPIIDLLTPYLTQQKVSQYKTSVSNAVKP